MLVYFARSSTETSPPGLILDAALSALGRASPEQIARVHQALGSEISASGDDGCDKTNNPKCEPPPPWYDPRGWIDFIESRDWERTVRCIGDVLTFWDGVDKHCGREEDKKAAAPKKQPKEAGKEAGKDPNEGKTPDPGPDPGPEPGPAPGWACRVQNVDAQASVESLVIRTRQKAERKPAESVAGTTIISSRPIVFRPPNFRIPAELARLVSVVGPFVTPIGLFFGDWRSARALQPMPRPARESNRSSGRLSPHNGVTTGA